MLTYKVTEFFEINTKETAINDIQKQLEEFKAFQKPNKQPDYHILLETGQQLPVFLESIDDPMKSFIFRKIPEVIQNKPQIQVQEIYQTFFKNIPQDFPINTLSGEYLKVFLFFGESGYLDLSLSKRKISEKQLFLGDLLLLALLFGLLNEVFDPIIRFLHQPENKKFQEYLKLSNKQQFLLLIKTIQQQKYMYVPEEINQYNSTIIQQNSQHLYDTKKGLDLKILEENPEIFDSYLGYLENYLKENGEVYKENYVDQCYNLYNLNKYAALKNLLPKNEENQNMEARVKRALQTRFESLYKESNKLKKRNEELEEKNKELQDKLKQANLELSLERGTFRELDQKPITEFLDKNKQYLITFFRDNPQFFDENPHLVPHNCKESEIFKQKQQELKELQQQQTQKVNEQMEQIHKQNSQLFQQNGNGNINNNNNHNQQLEEEKQEQRNNYLQCEPTLINQQDLLKKYGTKENVQHSQNVKECPLKIQNLNIGVKSTCCNQIQCYYCVLQDQEVVLKVMMNDKEKNIFNTTCFQDQKENRSVGTIKQDKNFQYNSFIHSTDYQKYKCQEQSISVDLQCGHKVCGQCILYGYVNGVSDFYKKPESGDNTLDKYQINCPYPGCEKFLSEADGREGRIISQNFKQN